MGQQCTTTADGLTSRARGYGTNGLTESSRYNVQRISRGRGHGLVTIIGTSGAHQWISGCTVDTILTLNAIMRVKRKHLLESTGNRCSKRVDTLRADDNYTANETHL